MTNKGSDKAAKIKSVPSKPDVVEPEHIPDVRIITISLTGYKNLLPMFSAAEVMASATFLDVPLGESPKVSVTDDTHLVAEHVFQMECDINSTKEIEKLISNPIVFTITQHPCVTDESMLLHMQDSSVPPLAHGIMSVKSAANLMEAFTNEKVDTATLCGTESQEEKEIDEKKPRKDSKAKKSGSNIGVKKGSKSKLSDTGSKKGSKVKVTEGESTKMLQTEMPNEPVVVGTCLLDVIPLFLGFQMMREILPILSEQIFYDDRMVPDKMMPQMMLDITVDKVWIFPGKKSPNLLNVTVESLYNLPPPMTVEMLYKVCIILPNADAKYEPFVFDDGKHTQDQNLDKFKRWAVLSKKQDLTSSTKYKIDFNTHDVHNKTDVDLDQVLSRDEPRIEWNLIRRNFLLEEAEIVLLNHLKKYRRIALEIVMMLDPEKEHADGADKGGKGKGKDKDIKKSDKSSKSSKGKRESMGSSERPIEFLHLMALVDVSPLLYPGVSRVRVACPLNTYQQFEASDLAGLDDSYFVPNKIVIKPASGVKSKSGKGDKDGPRDLKDQLPPPPPPPPQPSHEVTNEKDEPTFIIVEFELLHPIAPKRGLEDLTSELEHIIPQKPALPKLVITSQIATEYYYEIVRQLITDMNNQYQYYMEGVKHCTCSENNHQTHVDFLMFLRRNGIYQTYISSLMKAVSAIVNDKFSYKGEVNKSSPEYQNFIAEVFCHLVSEMNSMFNQITTNGLQQPSIGSWAALDKKLLYAREACELSADLLADRYYLERIAQDEKNADCWFDYAIFRIEIEDFDKAFECVHEALSVNIQHKYSLLLYGIMLTEKKKVLEAETCFLLMILQQPHWVEGWTVLFLFYRQLNNQEGADYCMEMAQKYMNVPLVLTDYFVATDDLAWNTSICPNTIFIRTAVLLIKMRAYRYAEKALSLELFKYAGVVHYMLGVIDFYKTNYGSALIHLQEAENLHGSDYAVGSISGHVMMTLGRLDDAKMQYLNIIESYNKVQDMRMVYINLAIVYELQDNIQEARKLLLLVCKHSPTAYSWLATGLLYYKQRDLLSAEDCLMHSNLFDNTLPETWAYLTIINLQLERFSEAELCYRQTLKNRLLNADLLNKIEKLAGAFGKFEVKTDTTIYRQSI